MCFDASFAAAEEVCGKNITEDRRIATSTELVIGVSHTRSFLGPSDDLVQANLVKFRFVSLLTMSNGTLKQYLPLQIHRCGIAI